MTTTTASPRQPNRRAIRQVMKEDERTQGDVDAQERHKVRLPGDRKRHQPTS